MKAQWKVRVGTFKGKSYPEIAFLLNGREESSIILTQGWYEDFFKITLSDQIDLDEEA